MRSGHGLVHVFVDHSAGSIVRSTDTPMFLDMRIHSGTFVHTCLSTKYGWQSR